MQKYLILMSPNGYEMSTGIISDPDVAKAISNEISDEKAYNHAKVMLIFELEREINDDGGDYYNDRRIIKDRAKSYKRSKLSQASKEAGGFDPGAQMAYYMRKNYAQVPGQKEFIFALNKKDMDWIFQHDPVTAGMILGELFADTESYEFVKKEIQDPRNPDKKRIIMGYNKMTKKEWDKNLQYDLEDFYDEYKAKHRSIQRRASRP